MDAQDHRYPITCLVREIDDQEPAAQLCLLKKKAEAAPQPRPISKFSTTASPSIVIERSSMIAIP